MGPPKARGGNAWHAYTMTAHRCQGATMRGRVLLLCRDAFAAGMLYVMLSRVPTRQDLHILGDLGPEDFIPANLTPSMLTREGLRKAEKARRWARQSKQSGCDGRHMFRLLLLVHWSVGGEAYCHGPLTAPVDDSIALEVLLLASGMFGLLTCIAIPCLCSGLLAGGCPGSVWKKYLGSCAWMCARC